MICQFTKARNGDGTFTLKCPVCHVVRIWPNDNLRRECTATRLPLHPSMQCLPGDHLHAAIVRKFGEWPRPACKCGDHISKMNMWGLEKCRQKINLIIGWLRVEGMRRGWKTICWSGKTRLSRKATNFFIKRFLNQCFDECERLNKEQAAMPLLQQTTIPIDVVYALGTGSAWQDNELRYSLRSLEKYATDLGRVFIVGHKPDWLQNVVHIPHDDIHKHNKDANIIDKVRAAIAAGCSERFIFASDDQCLMSQTRLADLPAYYSNDITAKADNSWGRGSWWARMRATRDYVASKGKPCRNFDTHVFQPHSATEFERVAAESNYHAGNGFCINTLTLNLAEGVNAQPIGRNKATLDGKRIDVNRIRQECAGRQHIGYNDSGLTKDLKAFFAEWFPTRSRFEVPPMPRTTNPKRGIVTLAGGPIYATNAYINCRMLRHMGCTLPIEWFYLGAELSPTWADLIQRTIPDVTLVDLGGTNRDNTKGKGGWQAKVEAVLRSQFDELLFLDADSFPLRDPTPLFDHEVFQQHDCILWPDIHTYDRRFQAVIRDKYGVDVEGRQIESGQMMFRKEACKPGLLKTQAINQNSKDAYKHLFGDKDTFLIGAKQGDVDVIVNPHVVRRCSGKNLMQHDLDGQRLFAHLVHGKWSPTTPAGISETDYPRYIEAERIWRELQSSNAAIQAPRTEGNMHVRDSFCAAEAAHIINDDFYKIRPMVGHRVLVRCIVDVGGNAGAFTIAASALYPESEIIVVEPDPELMADIRFNTRNCKATIHYVKAACVGDDRETVTYTRTASHRAGGFVRGTAWGGSKTTEADDVELTVPATTLPKLLDQFGFQSIDILKIDAEGVEGAVLMDLKNTDWMPRMHWIRGEWHGRDDWPLIEEALRDTHEYRLQNTPLNGEIIAHNREDV
jgi:FkbM family methyltransferase